MSDIFSVLRIPFKDHKCYNTCIFLVVVNVGVYFFLELLPPEIKASLCMNAYAIIYRHRYWVLVTYMFLHADMSHLIGNMVCLLLFGIPVERFFGSKEFLVMYFVCGVFSAMLSFFVYVGFGAWQLRLLGASGAIYGILLAFSIVYPRSKVFLWGIIPVPSMILIVFYAIGEFKGLIFGNDGNVSNITHIGGFLTALGYFRVRMRVNPFKVWRAAMRLKKQGGDSVKG